MNALPEADARSIAPAPVAENLMVYLDAAGHVWARNPATGIARHLTGKMPPVEDYLLVDGTRPMLGLLVLAPLPPTLPEHATTKSYLDARNKFLQDQIDLLLAGQIFIGSYDVVGDLAIFISSMGLPQGPLPPASSFLSGHYLICISAGLGTGEAPPALFKVGDLIFSDGTDWIHVGVGGPIVTAMQVAIIPQIGPWEDVQAAIEGLLANKVAKTGDVMMGSLYLPSAMPTDPDQATTKGYVDLTLSNTVANYVQKAGDTMTGILFMDLNLIFTRQGVGVVFPFGAAFFQDMSGTLVLNKDQQNNQPCIQNSDGSNRAPIIDQNSGDLRYVNKTGDAMSGALSIAVNTSIPAIQITASGGAIPIVASGGNIALNTDGTGLAVVGNGLFYKRVGTGIVIRQSSGNQQPQIENNDGSNLRAIIDTVNGDARYVNKSGDSMQGRLTLNAGATVPTNPGMNQPLILQGGTGAGATTQALRFESTRIGRDGGLMGDIRCDSNGYAYYGEVARFVFRSERGGYGAANWIWGDFAGGYATALNCSGALNANAAYVAPSEAKFKTGIREVKEDELSKAFAGLRLRKFRRVDPKAFEPEPEQYGLIVDDMEEAVPEAIKECSDPDGNTYKAYSLDQVVALLVGQVQQLKAQAELISQLQEQLATLEERFSNKIIADMEAQLSKLREVAGGGTHKTITNQRRQLPDK